MLTTEAFCDYIIFYETRVYGLSGGFRYTCVIEAIVFQIENGYFEYGGTDLTIVKFYSPVQKLHIFKCH